MRIRAATILASSFAVAAGAFSACQQPKQPSLSLSSTTTALEAESRRAFIGSSLAFGAAAATLGAPQQAEAVGPVKVNLLEPKYYAEPCPPSRPIPGEKAMKGMRGLCVTVDATLETETPKVGNEE